MSLRPGTVFLADCPARLAIEIISTKWAVVTLFALSEGPVRHGDLVELIGGVSRKVLTQTLRGFRSTGWWIGRCTPRPRPGWSTASPSSGRR